MTRLRLYTLCIDDYAPEITALTFPLLERYAEKMGAEFYVIDERCFPGWPPAYEKLQIYRLAKEHPAEWHFFLDADTLVHPESTDPTQYLRKDTVAHFGHDFAPTRWRTDRYFWRDGRHVGSCNWCTVASEWCTDLWRPLDDLSQAEAVANIFPTVGELASGVIDAAHLLDDYALSRNIARFGLKTTTLLDIQKTVPHAEYAFAFHHLYDIPAAEKVRRMKALLTQSPAQGGWGLGLPQGVAP